MTTSPPKPPALTLHAPAKINLGLSVLGLRPDGYHELSSIMAALNVGDTLDFTPADTLRLEVRGADLPTDNRNLVYRAAQRYLEAAEVRAGVHMVLHKTLPLASGLGGGSSDAATTLLALSRLYPAPMVDLPALAKALGADVPFFLPGGAALVGGIGEHLTPLQLPPIHLVLVNPGSAVSARDAYLWLDETGQYDPPLDAAAILQALEGGGEVPYLNSLERGVLPRHSEIVEVLSALRDAGLHSPLMSGSGATAFGLARGGAQAQQAAAWLSGRLTGCWVRAAQTV